MKKEQSKVKQIKELERKTSEQELGKSAKELTDIIKCMFESVENKFIDGIAPIAYKIYKDKLYKYMGWDTFNQWVVGEFNYSPSWFRQILFAFEKFVLSKAITSAEAIKIGISKLYLIGVHCENAKSKTEFIEFVLKNPDVPVTELENKLYVAKGMPPKKEVEAYNNIEIWIEIQTSVVNLFKRFIKENGRIDYQLEIKNIIDDFKTKYKLYKK